MVKLRAPMMSLGASGSIGNAITFSQWKGRAYARELVVPANPKSGLQTGFRSMFAFLSQAWKPLDPVAKASWQDIADSIIASRFNAYVKTNQRTWRNFHSPTMEYPAQEGATPPTWTSEPDVTAGVDSILMEWDCLAPEGGWGMVIYRDLGAAFTPSISNVVKVVPMATAGAGSWLDSPLDPDTYYYNCQPFTVDGVFGALTGEVNAEVT